MISKLEKKFLLSKCDNDVLFRKTVQRKNTGKTLRERHKITLCKKYNPFGISYVMPHFLSMTTCNCSGANKSFNKKYLGGCLK